MYGIKIYGKQSFFAPNFLSPRALHGAVIGKIRRRNVMLNIAKKIGLLFIGVLFLACSGSPAPVSAAPAQADELDAAIRETSDYLNKQLPKGNKLVILNVQSDFPALSEYIIDELIANTVNDRIFSVVDRRQLDTIRAELDFQYSGEVDDDTMQALGRMAGAQIIISGAVSKIGDLYRLRVRALSVQTAQIAGQFNRNIPEGPTVAALVKSQATGYGGGTATAARPAGQTAPASAPQAGPAATPPPVAPAVPPALTYKIGDTGPAGGIVFYDKGNTSGGWRYLEAAPVSTEARSLLWSVSPFNAGAKGIELGDGKLNTQKIIDASVQIAINAPAARYCDRLVQGGYDDWYLPSQKELGLMYMNLKVDGIGVFGDGWYWSSSEVTTRGYAEHDVWSQNFGNGKQSDRDHNSQKINSAHSVRAIRQF
jgi:hypothetical protein